MNKLTKIGINSFLTITASLYALGRFGNASSTSANNVNLESTVKNSADYKIDFVRDLNEPNKYNIKLREGRE